jgi:cytochrome c nitrite reductase small subunit
VLTCRRVARVTETALICFLFARPSFPGPPPGVPRPHGWIGTTEEWAQGLGIGLAVAEFALLFFLWRSIERDGLTTGAKLWLLVALVVFPLGTTFLAYSHGMAASETVMACGECHVMRPWVDDLRNPKSESLAALHYKNRYIQENHCYTCHSDYGLSGTISAKWQGLGHIVRETTGAYSRPIKIAHPFPNTRCLACHAESQKFLTAAGHPVEDLPKLISGETSCLECHGPAHPEQAGP